MRIAPWLVLACAVPLAMPVRPAFADTRSEARQQQLDRLFKALRTAPDEGAAMMIENRIRKLWMEQASPAAALLMARAVRELHNNADADAIADFDAVLELEPDFAEGYAQRALARAAAGDYAGAVRDIEDALKRDPRNFSALQSLSRIAEEQGNWRGALDAWQKALDIDPRTPGGIDRLEMLQKKVEGEAT
jgi:tetratricopeptide (TPR) repeat protein